MNVFLVYVRDKDTTGYTIAFFRCKQDKQQDLMCQNCTDVVKSCVRILFRLFEILRIIRLDSEAQVACYADEENRI
jgi:hypothetical protein